MTDISIHSDIISIFYSQSLEALNEEKQEEIKATREDAIEVLDLANTALNAHAKDNMLVGILNICI